MPPVGFEPTIYCSEDSRLIQLGHGGKLLLAKDF